MKTQLVTSLKERQENFYQKYITYNLLIMLVFIVLLFETLPFH